MPPRKKSTPSKKKKLLTDDNKNSTTTTSMLHRYVLLLRGINVGGSKCIKMADLKKTLSDIKFQSLHDDDIESKNDIIPLQNIKSYLASGNIIFELNRKLISGDERSLEEEITSTLMREYTFDVPVMIRHSKDFQQIISKNPFYSTKEKFDDLYVAMLMERPQDELIQSMITKEKDSFSPDEFDIVEDCIFLRLKNGAAKTKLTNTMFERKFKVNTTSRNWKTMLEVNKLLLLD